MTPSSSILMSIIGFDLADLEANQSGCLSTGQSAKLRFIVGQRFLSVISLIAIFTLALLIGLYLLGIIGTLLSTGTISLRWNDSLNSVLPVVLLYVLAATLIAIGYYGYKGLQLRGDLSKGRVRVVRGKVYPSKSQTTPDPRRRGSLGELYSIQISKITFGVSITLWSAINANSHYAIYYLPASKVIVSAQEYE